MNKIGINYSNYFGMTPQDNCRLFSQIGFDALFILHRNHGDTEAFAKAAQDNGLWLESLHAPFDGINNMWLPGDDGEVMLKRLCDSVEDAAEFDVPVVVVHLSSGDQWPGINDLGHSRFDRLVDVAVKHNVTIAFENQRKLANIAFAFETYANVAQVGFCWDMGHEACFNGTEFMPLFGDKLVYTHIHDNFAEPRKDLHMIPFDGKIDFNRRMQHLKDRNYQGTLTLEILPNGSDFYSNVTAEEYYKKAYAAALKLRDML